jgi:hypothetical protein
MKVLCDRDFTGLTSDENLALDSNKVVASIPLQVVPSKIHTVYSDQETFKTFHGLGLSTTWHQIDLPTSNGLFRVTPPEVGWYVLLALLVVNVGDYSHGVTLKVRASNGAEHSKPVFKWVRHRRGRGSFPDSTQKNAIAVNLPFYAASTNPIYLEMAAGFFKSGDDPHVFYGDSDPNVVVHDGVNVYHQSNIILIRTEDSTSSNTNGIVRLFPTP